MKWLDKLERKYGKYAIPNLMYSVIILYIVGFVINIVAPELYTEYLALDAQAILHGQIWRIFTFNSVSRGLQIHLAGEFVVRIQRMDST